MTTSNNTFKHIASAFVVGIFLFLAFGSNNDDKESDSEKFINGLAPVDVYLNMENRGFSTKKSSSKDWGNTWTNKMTSAGIEYTVETYSSNTKNVERVRATAMIDAGRKDIVEAQQFFIFLSSLPYENSAPQVAGQWIQDNYDNDQASTIIGDAKFTIYAPSVVVRMMIIEKAK